MKESKSSQQQKKLNVLLIGDSCIDQYIYGTCDRLNPEAPVPILKQSKEIKITRGMAFNVKDNLKKLGADVSIRTGGKPCIKTRYVDTRSGQQVLRVDEDFISPRCNSSKLQLSNYDAIVISDYNKGFVDLQVILDIIKIAKNKPIFIDTKIKDLMLMDKPNVFVKINETEHSQLISYCSNLIVTQGSKGAKFKNMTFSLSKSVDVADVCGAGDTFLAALTVKYLETKDIFKAINFANAAASISVQHEGIYAPTRQEVDCLYETEYNNCP
jgi:bifunctional ADP-heptose synthase (sugar kinase/adenylyltransferase)